MTTDALNIEDAPALVAYLRSEGRLENGETPRVTCLRGGVSNRTVLVEREPSRSSWVIKQALPKLRVQVEWKCEPARIEVEAAALRRLAELLPPRTVPAFCWQDQRHFVLAMEAVPPPFENWKEVLMDGRVQPDAVAQFGTMLGQAHSKSATSHSGLSSEFSDRAYFEKLRLEPYYEYSATQVPKAARFLRQLVEKTRDRRLSLVHGDYSPKNILVRRGRLILLDFEVVHWGDPAFDVGFGMTHLLSKGRHFRKLTDHFQSAAHQFWNSYLAAAGRGDWQADLESASVDHTIGCLLARVAGRSPLEYLEPDERTAQCSRVCELIEGQPASIAELIDFFLEDVDRG